MATQITNQAQLTFQYGSSTGSVLSNIATTTLQGPITVEKNVLADKYNGQDELTYVVSFSNTTNAAMSDVVITDNLGSYTLPETLAIATPLEYIGPAALYVNGSFVTYLNGMLGPNSVSFAIGSIGSNDNALIIYKARVNDYIVPSPYNTITNTVVVTADGVTESATASTTLPIGEFADVSIVKTMTPDPISSGDMITYNFSLYNYGNTAANNVTLTDRFSPAPVISSISVNGNVISPMDYSYIGGELVLPSAGPLQLNIPPASYTQDGNGRVTKVPGVTTISVMGTI